MGQAIGELLPFTLGVAISPIPIIAIILMLLSAQAGSNSITFMTGWLVGVIGTTIVFFLLSDSVDTDAGDPSTLSGVIKLVLGLLIALLGVKNFHERPKDGEEATMPKWLSSIESFTPRKSLTLGVLLSAVNPKNLLLIAGGMAAIAEIELTGGQSVVVILVFVLIAVSTVVGPVLLYRIAGEKAQAPLERRRAWLAQNNAVMMGVLLLVIGVTLIGKGISSLS